MNKAVSAIIALVVIVVGAFAVHHPPKPVPQPPHNGACVAVGVLPDPKCTPGTTYAGVTQANIKQTICVKGWTATIRPPQSYTTPLKVQSIKDYGYADTNLADYELDHLIPLELGGNPTDPKNLWAEYGKIPNPKDSVEGSLRSKVCSGTMSLQEAQHRISTNWVTALK